MMKIIQRADLHFRDSRSDKVYHVALQEGETGCTVDFAYGRRNTTLTRGTKTASPVSLSKAKSIYAKLVDEKLGKGYVSSPGISGTVFAGEVSDGSSKVVEQATAVASEKKSTGIFPQLLNAIDDDEAERLIEDPAFGAQEKKDGRRLLVRRCSEGQITGINRKSFVVPTSPAVARTISVLGRQLLADGEAMGDTLHLFGLLEYDGRDLRGLPYIEVHNLLTATFDGFTGRGVEIVPLAVTTKEKRDLYDRLKADKAEGIVFKRLAASYQPHRPASGGDHLKKKFTETASVIVLSVNEGKRSVQMGVYTPDSPSKPVFVGNCTIPPNYDIPEAGTVVEVEYLYAYLNGGSLFQPVYRGERTDIDAEECTSSQLKYHEEEAAAA